MPVPVVSEIQDMDGRVGNTLANQFIAHRIAPKKCCLRCLASPAVMVGPDDNDCPGISLVSGLGNDIQGQRGQH